MADSTGVGGLPLVPHRRRRAAADDRVGDVLVGVVQHAAAALVAHMSTPTSRLTDDVGGHDPVRIHAAYSAVAHKGQPTVILARSIKGYGLGPTCRPERHAREEEGRRFRPALHAGHHRLGLHRRRPGRSAYIMPEDRSEEVAYMLERDEALGGFLPERRTSRLTCPCRRPRPTWNLTRAAASNPTAPRWPRAPPAQLDPC